MKGDIILYSLQEHRSNYIAYGSHYKKTSIFMFINSSFFTKKWYVWSKANDIEANYKKISTVEYEIFEPMRPV